MLYAIQETNNLMNLAIDAEKRERFLKAARRLFRQGAIICDPDDPRTVAGLSKREVAFIRGGEHETNDCD